MFNIAATVTYHFSGTIRRFATPERFNNRELAEKAAQQLTHTSYLDNGVSKVVIHATEVVEVYHARRLPEPRGCTLSDHRYTRGCAVYHA